jgi:D-alanine-D-alanine ligase
MTPLKVGYPISVVILYSSFERDTVRAMEHMNEALTKHGHRVRIFDVHHRNWKKALHVPGDTVINLIEDDQTDWKLWEKVGRNLIFIGRPVVGFSLRSAINSISKLRMKKILVAHGLPTPNSRTVRIRSFHKNIVVRNMDFPLIVKPANQHASNGISQESVVIDLQELKERCEYLYQNFKGDILIEEFIEGREFHITVMGNNNKLIVLPYAEIDFKGEFADNWNVYSYNAKWKSNTWEYWDAPVVCPTRVPRKWQEKIDKVVKSAYRRLACCDVVRFDVRVDADGEPYIIDLNVSPDLTNDLDSECWRSARALKWTYADFIETLVAITYKRFYKRLPDRLRERSFLLAGFEK